MNLFFAARQHRIKISVASFSSTGTIAVPILQQACDITGGTHLMIDNPQLFGQSITKYLLINSYECDDVFSLNQSNLVDYRATCTCHSQLLDMGWVCTICLTVQCNTNKPTKCLCCNTPF